VANQSTPGDAKPIERWLAALRISEQIRSGQASVIYIDQLTTEETILRDIGDWALEKKRTKEELGELLTKLTAAFELEPVPVDALLADDILVRDVIEGKDLPLILTGENVLAHDYLAWLANDLPWERQRAIRALEHITLKNVHELRELAQRAANQKPREFGLAQSRWVRSTYGGTPELWEFDEPAAMTSYLASLEYKARLSTPEFNRAYVDHIVRRRAVLLQIALAVYRLDNQKYPAYLAYLVPGYVKKLPIDPYSNQAFVYESEGLSLPLERFTAEPGLDRVSSYIEPHTPVFWSVGPSNARLKQIETNKFDPADPDNPEGEAKQTSTPIYFVWPEEMGWPTDFPAVFPLAKYN
jgi:hypothetical protein